MAEESAKIAVLIDADNISARYLQDIMEEIGKHGTANVRRIYSDWSIESGKAWKDKLPTYGFTAVQQFAYTKGKNATDMSMTIDAMDLLYAKVYDVFCLITSDSDFTPLTTRIRESGVTVFVFGYEKTPMALTKACDRFFDVKHLSEIDTQLEEKNIESLSEIEDVEKIKSDIMRAINKNADEDTGWVYLSVLGKYLVEINPAFSSKTYGYPTLSKLLDAISVQVETDGTTTKCRKIPFLEFDQLIKQLPEKFQNENGEINIKKAEKHIKSHKDYTDYGFESFTDLLSKLKNVIVKKDHFIMENK